MLMEMNSKIIILTSTMLWLIIMMIIQVNGSLAATPTPLKISWPTTPYYNLQLQQQQQQQRQQQRRRRHKINLYKQPYDQVIVDFHNELRRLEDSSNMKKLKWDKQLHELALDWTKQCVKSYGHAYFKEIQYSFISQNMFVGSIPLLKRMNNIMLNSFKSENLDSEVIKMVIADVILQWYQQKTIYDYERAVCLLDQGCSNYLRIVRSNSTRVGCAHNLCGHIFGTEAENQLIVVCNYNYGTMDDSDETSLPHLRGEPCSKCDAREICDDKLCTAL